MSALDRDADVEREISLRVDIEGVLLGPRQCSSGIEIFALLPLIALRGASRSIPPDEFSSGLPTRSSDGGRTFGET